MENTREKLIELLESVPQPELLYGQPLIGVCKVADHLIANGVIIKSDCEDCASKTTRIIDKLHGEIAKLRKAQQWIPVTEPPEENGYYLCCVLTSAIGDKVTYEQMPLYWEDDVWLYRHNSHRMCRNVTHWMPLPELPKGE